MIKKTYLGLGIVALALTACAVGFNFSKEPSTNDPNNTVNMTVTSNSSNIKTVSSSVDMEFFTLDQLNSLSEIIVKGKAIEQSYYNKKDLVFSKTKIKIEKVYKGNVKKDDVLNIVEYGGITTEEDYNLKVSEEKTGIKPTEEQKNKARLNKIRVLIGGIPYSEVGKSGLYFVKKASTEQFSNQIDDNTYTPIGIQGRFDIKDDNTFESPRGINNELPELKITELDLEKILKK